MSAMRLKGEIIKRGYNVDGFAKEIGMCATTLRKKMRGDADFTIDESIKIKNKLCLPTADYLDIFFDDKLEYKAINETEIAL